MAMSRRLRWWVRKTSRALFTVLIVACVSWYGYGWANYQLTAGSGTNFFDFVTATGGTGSCSTASAHCSAHVNINKNGDPIGVSGTPFIVDGSAVTQPISAAALPLPSGAATAANQSTNNTSVASIDTKLSSQATAANQSTGNTSLASIDTKLTSQATGTKQDTGNTSLASIDTKLTTLHNDVTSAPALGSASNGWTPVGKNGVTNSSVTVKASAGQLGFAICDNNNAALTYLQLFDATSPSVGTNVGTIPLPPNLTGGFTISLVGLQFSNSIKVAATTAPGGSTAPGTTINCTFGYN